MDDQTLFFLLGLAFLIAGAVIGDSMRRRDNG